MLMPSDKPVLISRFSNCCGAVSTSTKVALPSMIRLPSLIGQHVFALVEHDVRVGAVVRAQEQLLVELSPRRES